MPKLDDSSQKKYVSPKIIFRRLGALVGFTLLFNIFFFHQIGSSALAFFLIGAFFFLIFLRLENIQQLDKKALSLFVGTLILLSLAIISRTFPIVQALSFLSGLVLLVVFSLYSLTTEKFWQSVVDIVAAPFLAVGSYLLGAFYVLSHSLDGKISELVPVKKETVSLLRLKSLVIGGIVGIVVLAIFIPLLSADPVFKTFINHINLPESLSKEALRVVFSGILFLVFLPLVYALSVKFSSQNTEKKILSFSFGSEVGVVTALVAILFAVYLFLAWPYLFVSVPTELHLSQIGVATYSEYVRKGFGEFLLAAGLLYGLLCVGVVALKSFGGKSRLLQVAHTIVFGEFILFVFSILRRVLLYQDYHGLSIVRIYGSIFLILVLLLGGTLIVRRLWNGIGNLKWATVEVIIIGLMVIFVAFFNVSQFLLLNPPTVNKRVDYVYLSRLSADGYDGWKLAYQYAKKTLENSQRETFIDRETRREVVYAGFINRQLLQNYSTLVNHYGTSEDKKEFVKSVCAGYQQKTEVCSNWNGESQIDLLINTSYIPVFDANYYGDGTFYIVDLVERKIDSVDRLLTYNYGENHVFRNMKLDMPLSTLLSMQRNYFKLFKRIASQPDGEREYEFDVSLSSPFISD